MVAPLTYGAGLKGKVTQSLAAGLPVVTTAIGAEGLDATDGQQMFVADDPNEQARRVIELIENDRVWRKISREGQRLAAERCSPEVVSRRLVELLTELGVPAGDDSGVGADRVGGASPAA